MENLDLIEPQDYMQSCRSCGTVFDLEHVRCPVCELRYRLTSDTPDDSDAESAAVAIRKLKGGGG